MQKRGIVIFLGILLLLAFFLVYFYSIRIQKIENENSYNSPGWALYNQRDYNGAIEEFQKYISRNNNNFEAQSGIAWSFYRLQDYDQAISHFTIATKLNPSDYNVNLGLGLAHYLKNIASPRNQINFELAKIHLTKARDINTSQGSFDNINYLLGRINYLENLLKPADDRSFEEAIRLLKLSIESESNPSLRHSELGWVYFSSNKPERALINFRKAENQDPFNPRAKLGIGFVYFSLNEFEKSKQNFEAALDLEHSAKNYEALGLAHLALENYTFARDLFQKAVDIDPSNPRYYDDLGLSYYYKKDYENALKSFNKSSELNMRFGTNTAIGRILGEVGQGWTYYQMGRLDEALASFHDSLSSNTGGVARLVALVGLVSISYETQDEENANKWVKEVEHLLKDPEFLFELDISKRFYFCMQNKEYTPKNIYSCGSVYRPN